MKETQISFRDFQTEAFQQYLQEKLLVINNGAKYGQVILLAGGSGCLDKDTPVIMADGSIKMVQDIESGDKVMGPDSRPRTVGELHTGTQEMLRVTTIKGDSYVCNRQHIHCFVCSFSKCGFVKGNHYNMTYDEWLSLPKSAQSALKIYKSGVKFKSQPVPFDPYVIGLWLGDGCCVNPTITIHDQQVEIVEHMTSLFENNPDYSFHSIKSSNENCTLYTMTYPKARKKNPLKTYLTTNCYNGYEKRIPIEYLRNSTKVRQQVLAGLIDSDGYNGGGYYEIITKYNGLKDDIYYLASSLGFQVTVRDKIISYKGEDRHYYRLTLSGSFEDLPIQCPYKKCQSRQQIKNVDRQGYTFELLPEDEYFGFSIVEPDKRFLLGNFIVTHNSGKSFAIHNMLEGSKFKITDVDKIKQDVLRLNRIKNRFPELKDLDLSNPKDTFKLHAFVKNMGWADKFTKGVLFRQPGEQLSNVIFDVTLKHMSEVHEYLDMLRPVGYEPQNIHIVWVLTDYRIALKRNKSRDRVVPNDIVIRTHSGTAHTMYELMSGKLPREIDGGIYVILGNPETTVFWEIDGVPSTNIKSFKYFTVKKPGKPVNSSPEFQKQVYDWIMRNVPKNYITKGILSDIEQKSKR